MKLALTVAEFNPLHNGHKYLLDVMRRGSDAVVVIMSGNFCQRGEAAVLDKYTRAAHAVKAGADIVFELPTVFSVAPAEIFAKGALKLLSSLSGEKTLFFGTERGEKPDFELLAESTVNESKEFKAALKRELSEGHPYVLARVNALKETTLGADFDILDNPNSVLGLEYCRAIKAFGAQMDISPVLRTTPHDGLSLEGETCSALAVRRAVADKATKKIKKFVPPFVYEQLPESLPRFDEVALYGVLRSTAAELKDVEDCTEGLENRIKALSGGVNTFAELIDKLETRRYTRARLQRIVTSNALGIKRSLVEKCLKSDLYLKVLAVAEDKKELLSELSGGKNKLLTRKADADKLGGAALACFEKDSFACDVYSLISGSVHSNYEMKRITR